MDDNRSEIGIVQIGLDVNSWRAQLPGVDSVRPAHCPQCGVASREPGRGLTIHGHGVVNRQQWGPCDVGGPPQTIDILLRRYRCLSCHAVIRVGPSGFIRRHLYSGPAIATALVLWLFAGRAARCVRDRISPWRRYGAAAANQWRSLRRWRRSLIDRRLWPRLETPSSLSAGVDAARQMLSALSTLAPTWSLAMPMEQAVFAAASHDRGGPSVM